MSLLNVLVPIADGSEEIETVCIVDTLVRAGITVTVASCRPDGALQITASRGVKLVADCTIDEAVAQSFDVIALPGGMPGAEHLRDSGALVSMLKAQQAEGRWIAAICASPAVVLEHHDLLDGAKATCYPAFLEQLKPEHSDGESRVVTDYPHKCITSQGPGTAIEFALAIIEATLGKDKAKAVGAPMLVSQCV